MLRRLYYGTRFGTYLKSEHGVKKFAEMSMGQLIRKVTKKSAFYREMNENLLVEKANLRMRSDELSEQHLLNAGKFFSVRRRLWANNLLLIGVMFAAFFLYHVSMMAVVGLDAGLSSFMTGLVSAFLALVLTGGGVIVTERLIESVIPAGTEDEELTARRRAVGLLWGFLLIGIEMSILGLTTVQAGNFATTTQSSAVYYGFVTLALLLPIAAGTVRWDAMHYVDAFKTTRAHRQIDSRLAQIDSILRQNEEYESNFYKVNSISYWDQLNEFKTYKDVYNERRDIVENLTGHFSQTYDTFQTEAQKRYESDIRDITTKSIRKLESGDRKPVGSKLGQVPARLRTISDYDGYRSEDGNSESSGIYMSPRPIR